MLVKIWTSPSPRAVDDLLDKFTTNYGKPKIREFKSKTKGGLELNDYSASWEIQDAVINMFRHIDRDTGSVSISSKSYEDKQSAKYRAQDEKAKKDF
jgi:hypothetical protein